MKIIKNTYYLHVKILKVLKELIREKGDLTDMTPLSCFPI